MAGTEKERTPFHERRWFQGTVAVVGLVGAIWAFSGAPTPWDAASDLTETELARADTQIILDASEGMAEPFGKGTKFDAAVAAIRRYARPLEAEGLSLRRTATECKDERSEVLVGFGEGHADDVIAAAEAQRPERQSTLAYAVIEAIGEFADLEQRSESPQQVVIVTGGVGEDQCLGGEAAEEIRRQLERAEIEATYKMVALAPTEEAQERLDEFAAALGEQAEIDVVETEEELEAVVADSLQGLTDEPSEPAEPGETGPSEPTEPGVVDPETGEPLTGEPVAEPEGAAIEGAGTTAPSPVEGAPPASAGESAPLP